MPTSTTTDSPHPPRAKWAKLLAAGLLAVPVACAAPPPAENPELPVEMPANWLAESPDEAVPGEVVGDWWERFGDANLTALIDTVIAENPDVAAASARIEMALAQAKIAGAGNIPTIAADAQAARGRHVVPGTLRADGTPVSAESSSFGVSLDVSWEIDIWGRVKAGESAALADIQVAQVSRRGLKLSLAAQAAKAYFAAIEAVALRDLVAETVASYRTTVDTIEARFEQGVRPALDVRLALANLAAAEALLAQRRAQVERVIRQIEILAGRYPAGLFEVPTALPELPGKPPTGVPVELLVRRPDLVGAERQIAAAGMRIDEARAALLPRLSLSASIGSTTNDLGTIFDPDYFIWNIIGNLVAPIFQGGRLRANVELSEARQRELFANYARTALKAFSEVETTLAVAEFLDAQQRALIEAASQAKAARELAESRYASGVGDLILLLDAQRRELDSRSQLIAVHRLRLENRVDLHLALGGGLADEEFLAIPSTESEGPAKENQP